MELLTDSELIFELFTSIVGLNSSARQCSFSFSINGRGVTEQELSLSSEYSLLNLNSPEKNPEFAEFGSGKYD